MAWSSSDHTIHTSPTIKVSGYINDDGYYNLNFWIVNSSGTWYGYPCSMSINGSQIFSFGAGGVSLGHTYTYSGTTSGTSATVVFYCGDTGCGSGAYGGKTIIYCTLGKKPAIYDYYCHGTTTHSTKLYVSAGDCNRFRIWYRNLTDNAAWRIWDEDSSGNGDTWSYSYWAPGTGNELVVDRLLANKTYQFQIIFCSTATDLNGWDNPNWNFCSVTEYFQTTTSPLSITVTDLEAHQFSISCNAIVNNYSSGNALEYNIDGGDTRTITATAGTKYKITFDKLISDTKHSVNLWISDGTNFATASVSITTLFPLARVCISGSFKKAIPYVYADSKWHKAKGYIRSGTAWKEFNAE